MWTDHNKAFMQANKIISQNWRPFVGRIDEKSLKQQQGDYLLAAKANCLSKRVLPVICAQYFA